MSIPTHALVQRDQCNGRTLSCINCARPLGERHDVLCYAYAIAAKKARLAARASSTIRRADPAQVHYARIRSELWSPLCTGQTGWVAPLARYMDQVTCEDCRATTEKP